MKTYVLALFGASLAAAVIELLSPRGEGGRLSSHVRMIAGLYLIVALLAPLRDGIALLQNAVSGDLTGMIADRVPMLDTDYEGVFGDHLSSLGQAEAEDYVRSALQSEFGIPPSDARVEVICTVTDHVPSVTEVRILLATAYATYDPHPIESYMEEAFLCPCYVTVDL